MLLSDLGGDATAVDDGFDMTVNSSDTCFEWIMASETEFSTAECSRPGGKPRRAGESVSEVER